MLVKKLIQETVIPTAKNYTVGVGAIVRDKEQLLVIKDRFSNGYKLPGGHIDNNESIKDALKREKYLKTYYGKMHIAKRLKSYFTSQGSKQKLNDE